MFKYAFAIFASVCFTFYTSAQEKIPVIKLKQDHELFVRALKEAHAGLHRYASAETMDSLFATTEKAIDHDMTSEEFYKLMMPVVAKIKCGHTKWYPENKPDDMYAFHSMDIFPLRLYFVNKKAFFLYSYDSTISILPGTEIMSIDGISIPSIIEELHAFMTIDGNVQSAVYSELNRSFNGYYATFINTATSFEVVYKEGDHKITTNLSSVTFDQIKDRDALEQKPYQMPLRLVYPAKDVALLTIESFYVDKKEHKYYPFIDSVFQELKSKRIDHLIIDVRNNEGGEENWGGYLFSYLTDKKFRYYDRITMAQKEKFSFKQYAWLPPHFGLMHLFMKKRNNEIRFVLQKYLRTHSPKKNAFKGSVYVLTNGSSFSVTSELCSVIQSQRKATFVGEETGGAYQGNNSGVFAVLTLPNTKLTLGIPLMAFYTRVLDNGYKNRGVLPDYEVKLSVYDVFLKRDAVLEKTLQLIQTEN
ncbi:MAG: S41 family peptidase [Ilyomonas sp.]